MNLFNERQQIIGELGIRWKRYTTEPHVWWSSDVWGFRITYGVGRQWRLTYYSVIAVLFTGTLDECMRAAEIYHLTRGAGRK